jgi:hypothetical protein
MLPLETKKTKCATITNNARNMDLCLVVRLVTRTTRKKISSSRKYGRKGNDKNNAFCIVDYL